MSLEKIEKAISNVPYMDTKNIVKYDDEHCILKIANELALLNLNT